MHVLVAVYPINRDHCKSLSFFERRGVLLMVLFVFCTSNHYNCFFYISWETLGDRQTGCLGLETTKEHLRMTEMT